MKERQPIVSFGIIIYGVLSVLFSIFMLHFVFIGTDSFNALSMYYTAYLITALCWVVFGIGVLARLPWARIGLIAIAGIYTVDLFEYSSRALSAIQRNEWASIAPWIIGLLYFPSLIIYFTRASVKKLFTKNKSETAEDVSSHDAFSN
jgi:hypothetical protein